ncbi:MAG TPA: hypothetical protein VIF09_00100 [Polyangiaceae bacterium]
MTPADVVTPTEPGVTITVPWLVTQLVPSPELAYGQDVARFGTRWQVTPLLFSWGIHRGLSPWRFLVAEPFVRQSGSIELFATPEYFFYGASFAEGWLFRGGVRSYFPLVEHGEYLSVSVGASSFAFAGKAGAAYEAGVYALYGILGIQLTVTPSAPPIATIVTQRIRVF